MKKASVMTIRVDPPPTVKSVPEPHPPPSCIPSPNANEPTITATPNGKTNPPVWTPISPP